MGTGRTRYETVLFDLDHTLLDSDASELAAFEATMRFIGISDPARYFAEYRQINLALWKAVERQELQPAQIRIVRFEQLVAEAGFDADPVVMADQFVSELGAHGDLLPGARDVLDELAGQKALAMVTNGLGDVQRARIRRLHLDQYFETVVISGEVGMSKPGSEIFDFTFDQLGRPPKNSALMIGDSLTSDIRGAADFGIATCWFNPEHATPGAADDITHEVSALHELPALL